MRVVRDDAIKPGSIEALELVRRRWAEAADGLGFAADHSEAHKQWWPIDLGSAD